MRLRVPEAALFTVFICVLRYFLSRDSWTVAVCVCFFFLIGFYVTTTSIMYSKVAPKPLSPPLPSAKPLEPPHFLGTREP